MESINHIDLLKKTLQKLYFYVREVVDERYKEQIPKLHEYPDAMILFACSKFKKEKIEEECDMYLKKYEIDESHKKNIMDHLLLLNEISQEIFKLLNP